VYTNYTTVTSSVAAISDQSQIVIDAGAQTYVTTNANSGVLTVSASNATLNLANAKISKGIAVSGSANNITIGANTNTITFSGSGSRYEYYYGCRYNTNTITDAKTVTVNAGANGGRY
jgi:hypothetical protein